MALHLLKLCVGVESVEDLEAYIEMRYRRGANFLRDGFPFHTTRMVPKRVDELEGGSLYWVIKGSIQCRQKLVGIDPFTDSEGVRRCNLLLESDVIRTEWAPRRAFQGWRYLKAEDAPRDVGAGEGPNELPPALRQELAVLGLL